MSSVRGMLSLDTCSAFTLATFLHAFREVRCQIVFYTKNRLAITPLTRKRFRHWCFRIIVIRFRLESPLALTLMDDPDSTPSVWGSWIAAIIDACHDTAVATDRLAANKTFPFVRILLRHVKTAPRFGNLAFAAVSLTVAQLHA